MATGSITPVKCKQVSIRKKYVPTKLSEHLMIKFRFMMEHGTLFDIKSLSPMFIYARCYINIFLNKHTLKSWEDDVESQIEILPIHRETTNDKKYM